MNEAELKIEAIQQVLMKRYGIITEQILTREMTEEQAQWYRGRAAGLVDAMDLLSDSLESIRVELE